MCIRDRQWASEFLRLYPSANILVTTKQDFETHNRKKFCARIATGAYDAIIMGHSQFEKIPISRERQDRLLYEQIDEITEGIAEVQASGCLLYTSYSFCPPGWYIPSTGQSAKNSSSSCFGQTAAMLTIPSFFLLTRTRQIRTCGMYWLMG